MVAILTCVRLIPHVVFICISLIISDLFVCPLAICMSSLEKYDLSSISWLDCLLFLTFFTLSCMSYLYIRLIPCQPLCLQIFSPIMWLSIHFIYSFFAVQKLLSLIRPHLFIFFYFQNKIKGIYQKRSWCNLCQKVFCLCSILRFL